jgi:hypothetical protein
VSELVKELRLFNHGKAADAIEAVLALHPKTCDMSGANCVEDDCPMNVCGPCGESWPCPTVKALQ